MPFMTTPSSDAVMEPSPSLSKSAKASRNSLIVSSVKSKDPRGMPATVMNGGALHPSRSQANTSAAAAPRGNGQQQQEPSHGACPQRQRCGHARSHAAGPVAVRTSRRYQT
eukprot:TRINITY_DN7236_c0_g1_i2.p3 TRINITY_DN7236_c0_g1~~TRINITY_DN7236_c0_g1_i2.p3  ORF type:complete len:111 (+),score=10.00 TRINITY_DN7236_c0_g1_i2:149-481(+)